MGTARNWKYYFGNDFDVDFLLTSTTAARTLPNDQKKATPVDACTTADAAPVTFQELLKTTTSITTIAVADFFTIVRGLWELLNHSNTLDEEKLPAERRIRVRDLDQRADVSAQQQRDDDAGGQQRYGALPGRRADPGIEGSSDEPLDVSRTIITAGVRKLLGTMAGTIHGTLTDKTGKTHRAQFPSLIVSGLGRHIFSATTAMTRGITTTLEEGKNPHLRKGYDVGQPEQQPGDRAFPRRGHCHRLS